MKKRVTMFFALAALSALVFTGCYRTPEQRAERLVDHISSELKLNDTQKAQLNKIKDEFLAKRLKMTAARNEGFDEAVALMKSDQIDQAKLNALLEKSEARTADSVKFFFTKFVEFHDMLTPEQRAKVAEVMVKHKARHGHW